MKDDRERKIEELIKIILGFSKREQQAILWLIENFDLAMEICGKDTLPEEQRRKYLEQAIEQDEPLTELLLRLEEYLHRGHGEG